MIRFTVPGEPVAKGRPKFTARGGFPRAITPKKTADYEELVRASFRAANPGAAPFPKETPVYIRIAAYFAIPKSASKKKAAAMREGRILPTKKPDCDNLAKSICDALNGLAYADDAQIVSCTVEKFYRDEPRAEVEIVGK